MDDEREKISDLEKKAEVFKAQNIPVHVKKHNGNWYNGDITELASDFFIINERKLGGGFLIFFHDTYDIKQLVTKDVEKREDSRGSEM